MKPYLTFKTYKLCEKVHDYLLSNNMNPFYIPSITQLGKTNGGFSLVKKISNDANGLKNFKPIYADYLKERYIKT